jgi:divalent metal cation (Fe/Co/Zn/Cd) transporter
MATRSDLVRHARRLEYLTITWNSIEAAVAVWLALRASSIALLGFGLDSVIETASGAAVLWRFGWGRDTHHAERRALRVVGICFIALAAYVTIDSVVSLAAHGRIRESWPGIILATVSLIGMPLLARAKRRTAAAISSAALQADSRQTDFCAYLSAILLLGLLAESLLGWWWADAVAALGMVPLIVREGVEAVRGETCCAGADASQPAR